MDRDEYGLFLLTSDFELFNGLLAGSPFLDESGYTRSFSKWNRRT